MERQDLTVRKIRIVADSSANIRTLERVAFASAPLKIITADREFVDDAALDVDGMIEYFDGYKGRSQTSCPNPSDWLESFGDAADVFCVAITSGLSGSYNAACAAKQMFEADNSDKRVCVLDSLSAGPELALIIEKLEELIVQGLDYDEICHEIKAYMQTTGLLFMLASLKNFAANGRVSPAVAKIAGILGIRIVGKASDKGQLEPLDKCRGENQSLNTILSHLKEYGYLGGRIRIAHCRNEVAAVALKESVLAEFPQADIAIAPCCGLCSYYAEKGGLLVGFEKG